jgi:uncharacterized membrane protein YgcG
VAAGKYMYTLENGLKKAIVKCEQCDHDMINVDAKEVTRQDLINLRKRGIRISNPNTKDRLCIACHAQRISDWYNAPKPEEEEDDSYHDSHLDSFGSMGGYFGGSGGFGGFGGGMSAGGGASGSW